MAFPTAAAGTGPVGRRSVPVSVNPYFPATLASEHEVPSSALTVATIFIAGGFLARNAPAASNRTPRTVVTKIRFMAFSFSPLRFPGVPQRPAPDWNSAVRGVFCCAEKRKSGEKGEIAVGFWWNPENSAWAHEGVRASSQP
jgi:hypothetical protein